MVTAFPLVGFDVAPLVPELEIAVDGAVLLEGVPLIKQRNWLRSRSSGVDINDDVTLKLADESITPWLEYHSSKEREWTCDHISNIEWDSFRVYNEMRAYYGKKPLRAGVILQGLAGTKAWDHDKMFRQNYGLIDCPSGAASNSSHGYRAPDTIDGFAFGYKQCCYSNNYGDPNASPSCPADALRHYVTTRGLVPSFLRSTPASYEIAITGSGGGFSFEEPLTTPSKALESYISKRPKEQRMGNYFGYTYGMSTAHKQVIVSDGQWSDERFRWRYMATSVGRISTFSMFHSDRHADFAYNGEWNQGLTAKWFQDAPCWRDGPARPDKLRQQPITVQSNLNRVLHRPDWFLDFYLGTKVTYFDITTYPRDIRDQWPTIESHQRCRDSDCTQTDDPGLRNLRIVLGNGVARLSGSLTVTTYLENEFWDGTYEENPGAPVSFDTPIVATIRIGVPEKDSENDSVQAGIELGTFDPSSSSEDFLWEWIVDESTVPEFRRGLDYGCTTFKIQVSLLLNCENVDTTEDMEYFHKFYEQFSFFHGGETEFYFVICKRDVVGILVCDSSFFDEEECPLMDSSRTVDSDFYDYTMISISVAVIVGVTFICLGVGKWGLKREEALILESND